MNILIEQVDSLADALDGMANADTFIDESKAVLKRRTPKNRFAKNYRTWFRNIEASMDKCAETASGRLFKVYDDDTNHLLGVYTVYINNGHWYYNWAYRAPDTLDSLAWAKSDQLLDAFSDEFYNEDVDDVTWDSIDGDTGHQEIDDAVATADGNDQSSKFERLVDDVPTEDGSQIKRRTYRFDKNDKITKSDAKGRPRPRPKRRRSAKAKARKDARDELIAKRKAEKKAERKEKRNDSSGNTPPKKKSSKKEISGEGLGMAYKKRKKKKKVVRK